MLCVIIAGSVFTLGAQAAKQKSAVSLNKKSLTLSIVKNGKSYSYGTATLKVNKLKGVKLKSKKFSSTNKKVATVNKTGKITSKKSGSTKIKVVVKYTYKKKSKTRTLSCNVKVKSYTNSVSLNKSLVSLNITQNGNKITYGSYSLKVNKISGVTLKKVTYKSSASKIAAVSAKGKLTSKKMGAATITATVKYTYAKKAYTKALTCKVKVKNVYKNILKELKLFRSTLATFMGNAEGIRPYYRTLAKLPSDFYLWDCLKVSVGDSSVVELGGDGLLIGKKAGSTTVTISSTDGTNLKLIAKIKVYNSREDMPLTDDLYEGERGEFLPKVMAGWNEETKKRYIDEDGNVRWSLFSQADIEYKDKKAKLIDEFRDIEKQPDNTSEDALASLLSTAKETREGRGDDKYYEVINNKLINKIMNVTTTDELLAICGEMGYDGLTTIFDSTTFFRKGTNIQLADDVENGLAPVPEEETVVEYNYYPIVYAYDLLSVYYSEDNEQQAIDYINNLLSLIGINDSELSADVLKFAVEIMNAEEDEFDWNDEDQVAGAPSVKVKFSELNDIYSNLKLKDYFTKVGYDLKDDSLVYISENNVFKILDKYFQSEDNLETLKTYTALCLLESLNSYTRTGLEITYRYREGDTPEKLTEEKINEYIDQYQHYYLDEIEYDIPWDVDQIYTARYYSNTYKQEFENLVDKFVDEYRAAISESWMSEKAKTNMLSKLNKTKFNNAYPSADEYKLLTVRDDMVTAAEGGSFADNLINLRKYKADLMRLTVGKKQGEYAWWAPSRDVNTLTFAPWTNNASFDWIRNQAFFAHVGISTLFTSNPDNDEDIDVRNIAYMSCTIGHEIGHAFDNLGSCFNGNGNLENLWADEDKVIYNKKVKGLADFYEHSLAYVDWDKKLARYQDGMNVVGEAMADLGGTEIALRILKKTYPDDDQKVKQFYKHTAQMWLNTSVDSISGDILDVRIRNEHPAYRLRTNNVASVMDEFYRVYDVKETDAMYVAPDDRVELWSKQQ